MPYRFECHRAYFSPSLAISFNLGPLKPIFVVAVTLIMSVACIKDLGVIQAFFLYALHAIYVSRISGKLSFCLFGTEFSENLKVFGQKMSGIVIIEQFMVKIFINPQFWNCIFLVKTEFLKIFGI